MKRTIHPLLFGFFGFAAMGGFYYALLATTTRDPLHPFFFFAEKWVFLAPLLLGFGAQTALFQKLCLSAHALRLKTTGASAGTSGVAMAACCAHHLADMLPVLGFMGLATIMTTYVDWFLAFGALVNLAGVLLLWQHLRRISRSASHSP